MSKSKAPAQRLLQPTPSHLILVQEKGDRLSEERHTMLIRTWKITVVVTEHMMLYLSTPRGNTPHKSFSSISTIPRWERQSCCVAARKR